jgi:hypothetical protein
VILKKRNKIKKEEGRVTKKDETKRNAMMKMMMELMSQPCFVD